MSRITSTFARLKEEKRAALIPFVMACDPDYDTSLAILNGLPGAGADIVELGIPFSDPMADGAVIQAAGNRALAAGAALGKVLQMAGIFRKQHPGVPLILMGYYNPIFRYGLDAFANDTEAAGVDGVIVVDLPPEEEGDLRAALDRSSPRRGEVRRGAEDEKRYHTAPTHPSPYGGGSISIIRLVTPTSDAERLPTLLDAAQGFIYYVAVAGVTGGKSADPEALRQRIAVLRQQTALPIAVGFGVKTAADVRATGGFADAVVVGSALVETIAKSTDKVEGALRFVKSLTASS